MLVQQAGSMPDRPIATESHGAESGQDMFSVLLLLALIGNSGEKHPPQAGGESSSVNPNLPIPIIDDAELGKPTAPQSEGAVTPQANLLEDPAIIGETPVNTLFKKHNETLMPLRGTKDNENVIPAKAGIQNTGRGLDSNSPLTTCGDKLRGNDGHLEVFSSEIFMSQIGMKATENVIARNNVSGAAIPKLEGEAKQSQHLKNLSIISADNDISTIPEGLKTVTGLFGDGDYQKDFDTNSESKGDKRWIGESGVLTSVIKAPEHTDTHCDVQPFYKYIDPENIMQHLSQRLLHTHHTGTHTARIRLKPEELGELSMDISVIDSSVKAVIAVENHDVKEIIEANLKRLEEELRNQGLTIEQFTVEMRGGGSGDRFMSAPYREETVAKRGVNRVSVDNSVSQGVLHNPVTLDSGVISIFV